MSVRRVQADPDQPSTSAASDHHPGVSEGMYEDVEVDPELFNSCRLCVKNKGKYLFIPYLRERAKFCYDIAIDPCDGLPQLLCEVCKSKLTEVSDVKKTYMETQKCLLEKIMKKKVPENREVGSVSNMQNPMDDIRQTQKKFRITTEPGKIQGSNRNIEKAQLDKTARQEYEVGASTQGDKTDQPRKNPFIPSTCAFCNQSYKCPENIKSHFKKMHNIKLKSFHMSYLRPCKVVLQRLRSDTIASHTSAQSTFANLDRGDGASEQKSCRRISDAQSETSTVDFEEFSKEIIISNFDNATKTPTAENSCMQKEITLIKQEEPIPLSQPTVLNATPAPDQAAQASFEPNMEDPPEFNVPFVVKKGLDSDPIILSITPKIENEFIIILDSDDDEETECVVPLCVTPTPYVAANVEVLSSKLTSTAEEKDNLTAATNECHLVRIKCKPVSQILASSACKQNNVRIIHAITNPSTTPYASTTAAVIKP